MDLPFSSDSKSTFLALGSLFDLGVFDLQRLGGVSAQDFAVGKVVW